MRRRTAIAGVGSFLLGVESGMAFGQGAPAVDVGVQNAVNAAISSNNASAIALLMTQNQGNPAVLAQIADAVTASGNSALIASVVVASQGNAAALTALGSALGSKGDGALVTAVLAAVKADAPSTARSLAITILANNSSLASAVANAGVSTQAGTGGGSSGGSSGSTTINQSQTGSRN